jgi:putative ABC transport system ATP-binding protein
MPVPSSHPDSHASSPATIDRVSKSYRLGGTRVAALREASMIVRRGELVGLAGPSGSGKSTLLHLIGCLDRPDSGTVVIDGTDVSRLRPSELATLRRDRLGFVFQSFNLVPVLSAFENVEYPMLLTATGARARRARVRELLDQVGLGAKADRRPDALSGGERQRVAVARALANGPSLVLADEPTANLDSASSATVLDVLDRLRQALGMAILVASHDPRVLERLDRVVTINDGVTDGAPARAAVAHA